MQSEINRLLHPASIAFIGGAECDIAIRRTRALGFAGRIIAVHPRREQLGGVPAIESVEEIAEPVDAAFVAVKREPAIEVVRHLRRLGSGGAVIYAAGFAETGHESLQGELLAAADGMPLMGPNCYGYVNGLARAALWPDEHGIVPSDKGVVIVTQSGNIACNLTMTKRAFPLAAVFTIGNMADIDTARMLTALAEDPRVTAIGLHIEGLRDVAAFSSAALHARERRKPVVALKTGRSEHGAKVALSHTSSLAGADSLYDAMFTRYGIARVSSVTAFVETLKFLHFGGPITDSRLVSLSCSGGEAALVADMAIDRRVSFPPFDGNTAARVKATLNDYVAIDNPLDYHTFIWNDEAKLNATFSAVMAGGFDCTMLVLDTPSLATVDAAPWKKTARAFTAASIATGARAVVVATIPENMPETLAADLAAAGVTPLLGLDDALAAFEGASTIGRNWALAEPPSAIPVPPLPVSDSTVLNEFAAKQLLARHGLAVPEGILCKAHEAAAAAAQLGYPVTLKVCSAAIAHKTEAGGVALNLKNAGEVEAAAARMVSLSPDVLVERMVVGAVAELIVGIKSDPQFGEAVVIGAGGILTEFLNDTVSLLLPTTRSEIEATLAKLKVWKLVEGFRGRSGDRAAVISAVEAVAAFSTAHRGLIVEADVNPLLVLPNGAIAVDALIKMRFP